MLLIFNILVTATKARWNSNLNVEAHSSIDRSRQSMANRLSVKIIICCTGLQSQTAARQSKPFCFHQTPTPIIPINVLAIINECASIKAKISHSLPARFQRPVIETSPITKNIPEIPKILNNIWHYLNTHPLGQSLFRKWAAIWFVQNCQMIVPNYRHECPTQRFLQVPLELHSLFSWKWWFSSAIPCWALLASVPTWRCSTCLIVFLTTPEDLKDLQCNLLNALFKEWKVWFWTFIIHGR